MIPVSTRNQKDLKMNTSLIDVKNLIPGYISTWKEVSSKMQYYLGIYKQQNS